MSVFRIVPEIKTVPKQNIPDAAEALKEAEYYLENQNPQSALAILSPVLTFHKDLTKENPKLYIQLIIRLSQTYQKFKHYEEAKNILEECLTLQFNPELYIEVYQQLAAVYLNLDEVFLGKSKSILEEKVLPFYDENPTEGIKKSEAYELLAKAYYGLNQNLKVIDLMENQVLTVYRGFFKANHSTLMNAEYFLALILLDEGYFERSLSLLTKLLEIFELHYSEKLLEISKIHYNMGLVYRELENKYEQNENFKKAWNMRLNILGLKEPLSRDDCYLNINLFEFLIESYCKLGQVQLAKELFAQYSQKNKFFNLEHTGLEHKFRNQIIESKILFFSGNYEDAKNMIDLAIKNISRMDVLNHDYELARIHHFKSIICQKLTDEEHLEALSSMQELVIPNYKKIFGDQHYAVAQAKITLAEICEHLYDHDPLQNDSYLDQAVALLSEVTEIFKRCFSHKHSHFSKVYRKLEELRKRLNDTTSTESSFSIPSNISYLEEIKSQAGNESKILVQKIDSPKSTQGDADGDDIFKFEL